MKVGLISALAASAPHLEFLDDGNVLVNVAFVVVLAACIGVILMAVAYEIMDIIK